MIQFHDGWQDEDDEASDEDDLDECPRCGRLIYDDSERCPKCGTYVTREEGRSTRPWWVTLGALICLAMVAYWILHP